MTAAPKPPAVSVVLPTFDRAALLPRAIHSMLGQSYADFELIVVDDGSTDGTAAVVDGLDDPRVVYLRRDHRGRSAARNAGARRARGEILTFLDSDDEAEPGWLGRLAAAFTEPGVGVVFSGLTEIGPDGESRELPPHDMGPLFDHQAGLLLAGAFAVRRELFAAIGGYDEMLHHAENTELGLRLLPYCQAHDRKVAAIAEPLVRYYKPAPPVGEAAFERRLAAAKRCLELHGGTFRRKDPGGYASYCSVAGVNAARLGRMREARGHFGRAVRNCPRRWRHLGRWLLTLAPPLARRVWAPARGVATVAAADREPAAPDTANRSTGR